MKIQFTYSYYGVNYMIVVLYHKDIEAQRIVFAPPLAVYKCCFQVLPGNYRVKIYDSLDGVGFARTLHDFWLSAMPSKQPRILKCRK